MWLMLTFVSPTGSLTNLLQKADVNIIEQSDCQQAYGNSLTPSMMCAGYMEGGKDTCLVRAQMTWSAVHTISKLDATEVF